jgi:hypothetical protein
MSLTAVYLIMSAEFKVETRGLGSVGWTQGAGQMGLSL